MRSSARIVAVGCAFALAGCISQITREQERKAGEYASFRGTASAERPEAGPLVAVLMLLHEGRYRPLRDWILPARTGGKFQFSAHQGEYAVWAFQDHNRDRIAQPTEPATIPKAGARFTVAPGEEIDGLDLDVPARGRPAIIDELELAGADEAEALDPKLLDEFTVRIATGEVVSLEDPRFDLGRAPDGMWRPIDYLQQRGAGIYFLEAYDPGKVPVLFVHGMSGSPQNFRFLIEQLDRSRFQPWVFHYPTGFDLDVVAEGLDEMVRELYALHQFDRLLLVAHSVGGLVSRSFILDQADGGPIRLLVSIATPWGGMNSASDVAKAQEMGLAFPAAWLDVAPGSAFITSLYYSDLETRQQRRRLPDRVPFHLFFGFQGRAAPLPGMSVLPSDGTVELRSQLAPAAQEEAESRYGFRLGHVKILEDAETAERLNEILAGAGS